MKKVYVLGAILLAIGLTGCGLTKKDLGMSREGPNAELVKTNEPLILPPNYYVRPKKSASVTENTDNATNNE